MPKTIFLLLFPLFACAQGVKWERNLQEAFRKARQENKVLFIEFYSPGCPYCQRIAPFFKAPEVAGLYNSSFVNYALNVDSDEARRFLAKVDLDVYAIPYFLFFRSDSTLLHAREVSADLNSILQPGRMMVEKTYTGEHYAKRFRNGERSENFLSHYALFSRIKKDARANRTALQALWEIYPMNKRNTKASWVIFKKVMMDGFNPFADHWLANKKVAEAFESGKVDDYYFRVLYGTIFSKEVEAFTPADWVQFRKKWEPAVGEKQLVTLVWEKEARSRFRVGDYRGALALGNLAAQYFDQDPASLKYMASVYEGACGICQSDVNRWRTRSRELEQKEIKN